MGPDRELSYPQFVLLTLAYIAATIGGVGGERGCRWRARGRVLWL